MGRSYKISVMVIRNISWGLSPYGCSSGARKYINLDAFSAELSSHILTTGFGCLRVRVYGPYFDFSFSYMG